MSFDSEEQDSGNVSVEVPAGTFRMDPVGFAVYATQFSQAARSIPRSEKFTPVSYYLHCRALELILKAFLLAKGMGLKKLKSKKYGHDLEALWEAAVSRGVNEVVPKLSDSFENHLAMVNSYYDDKAFEYFDFTRWANGYSGLPPLDIIDGYATDLIAGIKPYCLKVS